MKRILLLSLGLWLATVGAWGGYPFYPFPATSPIKTSFVPKNPYGNPNSPWYLGFGIGADIPTRNWDQNFPGGALGNFFMGYQLAPMFSVQALAEQGFFAGDGIFVENPRFLAELKLTFVQKGFQPYLLLGPGLDLRFVSPHGNSAADFDACAGLGFQFDMGYRTHLFLEGLYNLTFDQSVILQDVPIHAGLWVGL